LTVRLTEPQHGLGAMCDAITAGSASSVIARRMSKDARPMEAVRMDAV